MKLRYALSLLLLVPLFAIAATPQDATVAYVTSVVDATHSAAANCLLDRAGTAQLGAVTPGQVVIGAAPDFGTYTFGLTCSNSAGAATRVTFTATLAPNILPPNPPTSFKLTFSCTIPAGSSAATCVQS